MRKTWLPALLLALGLGLSSACGDAAASRDAALKSGDEFMASGKLAEALIAYRRAVQSDPDSAAAHLKLAEALESGGDYRAAVTEYVQAADRMVDDIEVQRKTAKALLYVGRFEDARGRIDKVLAAAPADVDAQIMKGNALAGLKDLGGALREFEQAVKLDPSSSIGYTSLGSLQLVQGSTQEAETAFKRAVFVAPQSVPAHLALSNFYWSSGRRQEAEASLLAALKIEPTHLLANKAYAILLMGSKRVAQAEGPLKVIADNSPTADGKLMLADYYVQTQRLADAQPILEAVSADASLGSVAKLRLASLGLLKGDRVGAARLVDEILAKDPNHAEALIGRAQLLMGENKRADALASARAAVAANPRHAYAHHVLGQILSAERQVDEAIVAFQDALRSSSGFAPTHFELAKLALSQRRYADAAQFARNATQLVPGYGEAHLVLARAEMLAGNAAAAEEPLRLLAANFPDLPAIQAELGRLYLMKNDFTAARAAFDRALRKDPVQVEAIEGLVALEIQQKQNASARRRLDAAVAAAPNNAALQVIASNLYTTGFQDLTAAERAARQAIAADPDNLDAYGVLARIHVQTNNLPAATEEFQKLAERQPKSVGNHTAVGLLMHLQDRPDQARQSYERALVLNPHAPVAANNLAQIYVDRNENLDIALQLAQTAKAGLPNSHEVDDTIGWIHYRKGNAPSAITALKAAVTAQPDNPVYLYHLGAAYALAKDRANGRSTLERALQLRSDFPGADDARRILDTLK